MKISRYWIVFIICAVAWIIASLSLAPSLSGIDVWAFRDAGWNLASTGSFESLVATNTGGATPKLYSSYTPIMPLLFAGYASILPRNAYAGTIFNLLIGLTAAAVMLGWVIRQPQNSSIVRSYAALAVAILPVIFVTFDRPEAIGLILFSIPVFLSADANASPIFVGIFVALTFLGHPFSGIAAGIWASALVLSRNWHFPGRWLLSLREVMITGMGAIAVLIAVALAYYSLDHNSLARFLAHALGISSGLGPVMALTSGKDFLRDILDAAALHQDVPETLAYFLSLVSSLLLVSWCAVYRKELRNEDWISVCAGLACTAIAVFLFPRQGHYLFCTTSLVPLGLLAVGKTGSKMSTVGLLLLLFGMFIRLPAFFIDIVQRSEQRSSYEASLQQPSFLLAHLQTPDALVAVEGDDYDLFKPQFQNLFHLGWFHYSNRLTKPAAIANCYDAFHGPDTAVRPLPSQLDPSEFHMIQAVPQHLWITILGHRVMRGQWGYGCDLYVRNGADNGIQAPLN